MAETTARQLVISALIFTALISGSFIWISNFASTDSDFQEYNVTFQKFNNIKTQSDAMQKIMSEDAEPSSGVLGILNGLIESSWGAISLIWDSIATMGTLLSDLTDTFGIPVWFSGLLIAIIGISIAFAIMAAIFKWHI